MNFRSFQSLSFCLSLLASILSIKFDASSKAGAPFKLSSTKSTDRHDIAVEPSMIPAKNGRETSSALQRVKPPSFCQYTEWVPVFYHGWAPVTRWIPSPQPVSKHKAVASDSRTARLSAEAQPYEKLETKKTNEPMTKSNDNETKTELSFAKVVSRPSASSPESASAAEVVANHGSKNLVNPKKVLPENGSKNVKLIQAEGGISNIKTRNKRFGSKQVDGQKTRPYQNTLPPPQTRIVKSEGKDEGDSWITVKRKNYKSQNMKPIQSNFDKTDEKDENQSNNAAISHEKGDLSEDLLEKKKLIIGSSVPEMLSESEQSHLGISQNEETRTEDLNQKENLMLKRKSQSSNSRKNNKSGKANNSSRKIQDKNRMGPQETQSEDGHDYLYIESAIRNDLESLNSIENIFIKNLVEEMKRFKEREYQFRDKMFGDVIQEAFHPSNCEEPENIYKGLPKDILGYAFKDAHGIKFAEEIELKLEPKVKGITTADDRIFKKNEVVVNSEKMKAVFLRIVKEHLDVSNPEDYLSLSPMDSNLHKTLQIVWYLDSNLVRELPKHLGDVIKTKYEMYRRFETFRAQVYEQTVVENWGILSLYLMHNQEFTIQEINWIQNDFALSICFPCPSDFSNVSSLNIPIHVYFGRSPLVYQILEDFMGKRGAQKRIFQACKVLFTSQNPPKIWSTESLVQCYKLNGCSFEDVSDLLPLLHLSEYTKSGGTVGIHKNDVSQMQEIVEPNGNKSLVPWFQSSGRRWMAKNFKNYDSNLRKEAKLVNERSESKETGDLLKFADWGLDAEILELLVSMLKEEMKDGRKGLNWALVTYIFTLNLDEGQKRDIESYLTRKINSKISKAIPPSKKIK